MSIPVIVQLEPSNDVAPVTAGVTESSMYSEGLALISKLSSVAVPESSIVLLTVEPSAGIEIFTTGGVVSQMNSPIEVSAVMFPALSSTRRYNSLRPLVSFAAGISTVLSVTLFPVKLTSAAASVNPALVPMYAFFNPEVSTLAVSVTEIFAVTFAPLTTLVSDKVEPVSDRIDLEAMNGSTVSTLTAKSL